MHARPTRYAGAVLLGRIDDRRDGRELLRRLIPSSRPGRLDGPEPVVWAAVGLSFQGLKALGVPDGVAGHLPIRVPAGHGRSGGLHRATSARARRSTGRHPLGFDGRPRRGGRARAGHAPSWRPSPGWRSDAVRDRARRHPGLDAGHCTLPTRRTRAVRLQGLRSASRPSRAPTSSAATRTRHRSRPASSSWATRTRPATVAGSAAGGAGPQRHVRGLPQAAPRVAAFREYLGQNAARRRRAGVACGQVRRALAERRAARPGPGQGRPRTGRRPRTQQRLHVRRRPAGPQVPGRRARPEDERTRRGHHRTGRGCTA